MSKPLHCWHGNTGDLEIGTDGHEGPQYTPDGEIEVEFL